MAENSNGDDGRDRVDCEYATLECRWSADDTATTTVHVKASFYDEPVDDRRTVLRVSACVVASEPDVSGVYEGRVNRDQVIAWRSDVTSGDEDETVRVWLKNARSALIASSVRSEEPFVDKDDDDDLENGPARYVHCLQRADGEEDLSRLLLSWKIKLRPFGMAILGKVSISRVTVPSELVDRMSVWFVTPLIGDLSAERRRLERAKRLASQNERRLLEDNRRLVDQLRLLVDKRQRDERLLMTRFVEVLNAKKLRLAAVQRELSELKRCTASVVDVETEKEAATIRGDGRRNVRGGHSGCRKSKSKTVTNDEQTDDNKDVAKKRRYVSDKLFSVVTKEKKHITDDLDVLLQNTIENHIKERETTEAENAGSAVCADRAVVEVKTSAMSPTAVNVPVDNSIFDADTLIDEDPDINVVNVKATTISSSPTNVNVSINDSIFEADTLIDDDMVSNNTPDGSPVWLQKSQSPLRPKTTVALSPPPLSSVPDNNVVDVKATTISSSSPTNVNVSINDSIFEADTLIDDDMVSNNTPDGSPVWLQKSQSPLRPKTTVALSPPPLSSVPDNNVVDVKATTISSSSPKNVNVSINDSIFEADTLIDDDMGSNSTPDGSPVWLQKSQSPLQPKTTVAPSPPPGSPVKNDNGLQQTEKKSVLDSLWYGIL